MKGQGPVSSGPEKCSVVNEAIRSAARLPCQDPFSLSLSLSLFVVFCVFDWFVVRRPFTGVRVCTYESPSGLLARARRPRAPLDPASEECACPICRQWERHPVIRRYMNTGENNASSCRFYKRDLGGWLRGGQLTRSGY